MKKLIIATRKSKLALWQSEHVKALLERAHPHLEVELSTFSTKGDKILDTPLALIGGKGLFTKELEEAMKRGEAHIAVHSLKDVPTRFEEGLVLGAVSKREDVRDAYLSQNYPTLDSLPQGSVVGTTSLRRRMQLLSYRPDLVVKDLRGNVGSRMDKLKNGEYDAIILAQAGLVRLEVLDEVRYTYPLDTDLFTPAMGQAALGIESIDDPEILNIIAVLNDENSMIETTVERSFIDTLEGGCQVPIGINAKLDGDTLFIRTVLGLPNGKEVMIKTLQAPKSAYKTIGIELAQICIQEGARELLSRAEAIAFKQP